MNLKWTLRPVLAAAACVLPVLAQDISSSAREQIAQVLAIKKSFSPAMQKMDSDTAFGLLKDQGLLPAWMANITNGVGTDPVRVQIGTKLTPELSAYLASIGATIEAANPSNDVITALVPPSKIAGLAGRTDVKSVGKVSERTTNGSAFAPRLKSPFFVGALTSQGYISHKVNLEIAANGYTGAGVKVGVLSDSATAARVATLIASGDLGAGTTVLAGQAGSGSDEGTAMMEIVQDMAPGATVYFATAFTSAASFAANIVALANAGCKVIVDDVSYFNEGVFQDGPIAQAVNTVTAMGVTYISSAGNDGNKTQGTSGVWEGDFVDGGALTTGPIFTSGETGNVHSFGAQLYNTISATGGSRVGLKWADPLAGSTNDYDLFILDSTGATLKKFSAAAQTGTQDPYESVSFTSSPAIAAGDRVVVVLYDGQPRALHLGTHRGRLSNNTAGAVYGHNGGLNTLTSAAVYWNSAKTGTKPFVGGAANKTENFSSDGPRRIFFQPDGTPITPGNFLFGTSGGTLLSKPDAAGADGVSTKTPGFLPFYGTSAAAPHIAGIAALIMQARPDYTPAQVKAAIYNSAFDNMAAGIDRDSGYGIAMALEAVKYAVTH